MPYLLGADEAGYGPNLGPLVVSATVWHLSDDAADDNLYDRLAGAIVRCGADARGRYAAVADSKKLYTQGKGLRHLERGLLAALGVLGRKTDDWPSLWAAMVPEAPVLLPDVHWHDGYTVAVPVDAARAEIEIVQTALQQTLDDAGVRLVDLRSRAVFPDRFNRLIERRGSKGSALSHLTLGLLAELIEPFDDEPIRVVCDKHGGRNSYAALLAENFLDGLVEVVAESRERSVYRFGPARRRVEIAFETKAESHLPVALASMASKYLRELSMGALNAFWSARVEGLRPTAGYPQDAKRFKAEIATAQAALGIDDAVLWRNR